MTEPTQEDKLDKVLSLLTMEHDKSIDQLKKEIDFPVSGETEFSLLLRRLIKDNNAKDNKDGYLLTLKGQLELRDSQNRPYTLRQERENESALLKERIDLR